MADSKITGFNEDTAPSIDDLLVIVNDPAGTPANKKVTLASVFGLLYPVGSIYISTLSTNPGTLLGVGTWTAFGAGRTLVSLNSGDTDFDTVEETGGAKTHTLTIAEMPSHQHTQQLGGNLTNTNQIAGAPVVGDANSALVSATGGGGAHNNLQPYIVVYMWKRTA